MGTVNNGYHLPSGGTHSAGGLWLTPLLTELGTLVLAPLVAAQYLAWRFAYSPHLGKTWIGPLYAPWDILWWYWYWGKLPGTETWWFHAELIIILAHIAPFVSLFLAVRRSWLFGGKSDLHGSARWATEKEIKRMELL